MTGWKAKRFWKAATVATVPGGFGVLLDARALRTPAKAALVLPSQALAEAIAAEWQAQEGLVRPDRMPLTRYANSALDKVAPQHAEVVALVAAYGGSDLLCYRAAAPQALAARQAAAWDPWLAWSAALGAPLATGPGVVPVPQPEASLAALQARVAAQSPFALAALHDLVAVTGSLVLGLAVLDRRLDADTAFDLSRIDEAWQAEHWGHDAEAAESEALKRQAIRDAARFLALLHGESA